MNSSRIFRALLVVSTLLTIASIKAAAPDLTGTWKYVNINQNGEKREFVFKLKQDDHIVTGTVTTPQGDDIQIKEGKIDDNGNLTFMMKIERDDRTLEIRSSAKLSGDSLKGKTEFPNRDGEKQEQEWEAKRESKAKDISGNWNSSFTIQDGTKLDSDLRLKQDANKLTGTLSFNDNQTEIHDGKIDGENIAFKILRDRDGRTVTSKYQGKLQADGQIKGQIESDWTGEVRRLEWEAKKAN